MQNAALTKKGHKGPVPARLMFILAREAPIGVVFRRGPSDWVEIVKWNTDSDTFEPGQWFHGRIYDRRCDLSPDGSLLVYFAQKINGRTLGDREYTYAWTAISRPPYLTALALWPKGDCWHGGGAFDSNTSIVLNHGSYVSKPHPKHLPGPLNVSLRNHVQGEDDPVFGERLERDGWRLIKEWEVEDRGHPSSYFTRQPEVRERQHPSGAQFLRLTRSISGLDYSERFAVRANNSDWTDIDGASWAEWDARGRLVFGKNGKLYAGTLNTPSEIDARELLDLNLHKPASVRPPDWATHW